MNPILHLLEKHAIKVANFRIRSNEQQERIFKKKEKLITAHHVDCQRHKQFNIYNVAATEPSQPAAKNHRLLHDASAKKYYKIRRIITY